jgi:hypothetical protein
MYNCLVDKVQYKITYSDANTIVGSKADWIMGLASDWAIEVRQCKGSGLDYSVYFHAQARYTQFIEADTETKALATNFY